MKHRSEALEPSDNWYFDVLAFIGLIVLGRNNREEPLIDNDFGSKNIDRSPEIIFVLLRQKTKILIGQNKRKPDNHW